MFTRHRPTRKASLNLSLRVRWAFVCVSDAQTHKNAKLTQAIHGQCGAELGSLSSVKICLNRIDMVMQTSMWPFCAITWPNGGQEGRVMSGRSHDGWRCGHGKEEGHLGESWLECPSLNKTEGLWFQLSHTRDCVCNPRYLQPIDMWSFIVMKPLKQIFRGR